MKKLVFLFCLLFTFSALAEDGASSLKPLRAEKPGITVIDGKRFFSLQNARRQTGSGWSPSALSVMHHPRDPRIFSMRRMATLPAPADSAHNLPTPSNAKSTTASEQLLSIFAPEDKASRP